MIKDWKTQLAEGIKDIRTLNNQLAIDDAELEKLIDIQKKFPIFIPEYYLSLIDTTDKNDPILKMSVPSVAELDQSGTFDTSGEHSNTILPGLQHKYAQTALILSTNKCAMYCRHCFRKRLVGTSGTEILQHLDEMAEYIKEHTEITNVLISGGDSFLNKTSTLKKYLEKLTPISHIDFIRFGTRTPVVLPDRITTDPELLSILNTYGKEKQLIIVTQFNHPKEITASSMDAINKLKRTGAIVRNQTVLLRGINDDPKILGTLLKQLTAIGVLPYYVFQCRPVTGVKSQFQVPLREGYQIVEGAKDMQNGQGKSFRYAMSHETGKIEILGDFNENNMLFKYHQAKHKKDRHRIFTQPISDSDTWLKSEKNF